MVTIMKKILITGDSITDHHIYKGGIEYPRKEAQVGTCIKEEGGGASLLYQLVNRQCEKENQYAIHLQKVTGFNNHAYAVWKPCRGNHQKDDACDRTGKIWRVTERLGYGPSPEIPRPSKTGTDLDPNAKWDVVIFDDGGLGYRFHQHLWLPILSQKYQPESPWIIMKMSHQVGQGDLWAQLSAGQLLEHTVLIVSVDDLRRNEVMITRGRSWEQTIRDLLKEFEANVHLRQLLHCRHVIVHFGNDGALWINNEQSDNRKNSFFFDPGCLEGEWNKGIEGTVLGSSTCFTAGIICSILKHGKDADSIGKGITDGLCAMRTLCRKGHGLVGKNDTPAFPGEEIIQVLRDNTISGYKFNRVPIPDTAVVKKPDWSIMASLSSQQQRPLYGRARQVAVHGAKVLNDIPYGQFGALYSVDHAELESLNSIRNLINQYVHGDKGKKPLCLGVFGPPGAGKSFGVKQIAKGILGSNVSILEFNLSQFDDYTMLVGAFHQVRDKALEGKIPVVFWDEFDSKELKWLQYLLSPMQDGAFLEGQLRHPIGKCIFVFAGGTRPTMQAFSISDPDKVYGEEDRQGGQYKEDKEIYIDFTRKKGPDFVSRLRGYLNVLGPNRKQVYNAATRCMETDSSDICFPIRRALLLRVMAGISGNDPLKIDSGLLNAFLKIKEFKHGARSMETLVALISGGEGKEGLMRSKLPPKEQISLHVDYDEFLALIQQGEEFQQTCNGLAPFVHARYQETTRTPMEYKQEFDELPANIKADNVAAALRITQILSLISMQVVPKGTGQALEPEIVEKEIEANIELLAEAEHIGWMESKISQGWRAPQPGETRDDENKIHPCLVPYGDLKEEDKEKDRESVRYYPKLVELAGYMIVYEE